MFNRRDRAPHGPEEIAIIIKRLLYGEEFSFNQIFEYDCYFKVIFPLFNDEFFD